MRKYAEAMYTWAFVTACGLICDVLDEVMVRLESSGMDERIREVTEDEYRRPV